MSFAAQSGQSAGRVCGEEERHSIQQITAVLQQVGVGMPVGDVCAILGVRYNF
jgi:hypothetical protein